MNNNSPSSRSALRRLLVVLAIVIGFVVYAWGWQTTDISLEETQNPTRQVSVQRALRELLSPNIFDQDYDSAFADANFQVGCTDTDPEQPPVVDGQPFVLISPLCGSTSDTVTVEVFNFAANSPGLVRWIPASGQARPLTPLTHESNDITLDPSGSLKFEVAVPSIRGSAGEIHRIEIESRIPVGAPYLSSTTRVVLEKIVETIFLALMATTVAVPISFAISFLAARNLMKQITMPLGNVLVGFILLPVGWVLGTLILGLIGQTGVTWGKELILGVVGSIVVISAYSFIAPVINRPELTGVDARVRSILMGIVLLAVIVFTLGALGGVMIWVGQAFLEASKPLVADSGAAAQLVGGLLGILGNFLSTLGSLVDYSIVAIAGVLGAFWVASTGMNLT
ncbi:MAG: hypothetical protein K8I60_19545, partial [Anaerolineae bacterium]|nr:hypothetical protein [Anaerolineae bacterium]